MTLPKWFVGLVGLAVLFSGHSLLADDTVVINNNSTKQWMFRVVLKGRVADGTVSIVPAGKPVKMGVLDMLKLPPGRTKVTFGSPNGNYYLRFQLLDSSNNWVEMAAIKKMPASDSKTPVPAFPAYVKLLNSMSDYDFRLTNAVITTSATDGSITINGPALGGASPARIDESVFGPGVPKEGPTDDSVLSGYLFNQSKKTYFLQVTALSSTGPARKPGLYAPAGSSPTPIAQNKATKPSFILGQVVLTDLDGNVLGTLSTGSVKPVPVPPGIMRILGIPGTPDPEDETKTTLSLPVSLVDENNRECKLHLGGSPDGIGVMASIDQDATVNSKLATGNPVRCGGFSGKTLAGSLTIVADTFPDVFPILDITRSRGAASDEPATRARSGATDTRPPSPSGGGATPSR